MKGSEIARRRMFGMRLWGAPLDSPEEAVRWLGAMQGQELPVAKWSIGQRADGATEADIDRAFADGTILRTHILRPTWHFVHPADLRWLLSISAPRVHALNGHYYRKLELDDRLLVRSQRLLAGALNGGVHRTRKELAADLQRGGIDASGLRMGYILMRAELDAVVVSGAPKGKQQTYALFDERVPPAPGPDRDEALAELTRRYFRSRGPATVNDFTRWSSLTVADGRRGLDLVSSELEQEVVDGRTFWFAPPGTSGKAPSIVVDLVQGYDECVMSYSESRDALWATSPPSPTPPPAIPPEGITYLHAILLNGQVTGRWRPVRARSSVVIETALARPFRPAEARALNAAVQRYGRFLGLPATLA